MWKARVRVKSRSGSGVEGLSRRAGMCIVKQAAVEHFHRFPSPPSCKDGLQERMAMGGTETAVY